MNKTKLIFITLLMFILLSSLASATIPENSNIVGHWKLDEGTGSTAYDETSNNDATITDTAIWTNDGKIGTGIKNMSLTGYCQIQGLSGTDNLFWFNR